MSHLLGRSAREPDPIGERRIASGPGSPSASESPSSARGSSASDATSQCALLNASSTVGFELIRDAEGREMVWLERFLGQTPAGNPIHLVDAQLYVGPLAAGQVVSFGNCARDPRPSRPDGRIVAVTRPATTGSIPVVRAWLIETNPPWFRLLPAGRVHCLLLGD